MRMIMFGLLAASLIAQETVLFDQLGQPQWSDTSVEISSESYRLLADDFDLNGAATITKIDISGTMPEDRSAAVSQVKLRIFRDASRFPGQVIYDEVFEEPDPDNDGSFTLMPTDLVLDAGTYWMAVSELFYGVATADPWRWNGADQVMFGNDYAISSGEGNAPGTWAYSHDVYGSEFPPGTLYFRLQGFAQGDVLDPDIPPPSFITDRDVWLDEDNKIVVWCPDPNADGAVQRAIESRGYTFRLVQDCQVLETVTATPSVYPQVFKFSSPIPDGPYTIEVARYVEYAGQGAKRGSEGIPRVYAGPDSSSSDTMIATKTNEIGRWLLHLPKVSGGFKGKVRFFNRFPEIPASIWVAGFDADGNHVAGTRQRLLIVGQVQTLPLYAEGGDEGLFDAGMMDRVSHLGLFEPKGAAYIETSLTYQSIEENALTATVDEASLLDGTFVGAGFSLDARPATAYWDGAAVLNLTGSDNLTAVVSLVSADGQVIDERQLDPIVPGSKHLLVLSELFPQSGTIDAYYTVASIDDAPFQVLGLRGTLVSSPPLLVNTKVSKVQ